MRHFLPLQSGCSAIYSPAPCEEFHCLLSSLIHVSCRFQKTHDQDFKSSRIAIEFILYYTCKVTIYLTIFKGAPWFNLEAT